MKKFTILSVLISAFLLSGCSSNSQITGELTVTYVPTGLPCEPQKLPAVGSISSGANEILGSVSITSLLREIENDDTNSRSCVFSYSTSNVDLKLEVLVIEFGGDQRWSGRWILSQDEFKDGTVNLRV